MEYVKVGEYIICYLGGMLVTLAVIIVNESNKIDDDSKI